MVRKEFKLTEAQEQCLRDQVITADQPGPVLRDFRMLLDFLGPEGVEAGGKYNLLPMKFIGELDRRLSRPLHLELKRPQLRSHPYLQGLNLLLRASGLSRVEGAGAKARLVLDPAMLAAVGPAQPHRAVFQPAGSLAPVRPRGDGRGTGLDPGGTCSCPACKPGSPSRRKAAGSTSRSRRTSTSPGSAGISTCWR